MGNVLPPVWLLDVDGVLNAVAKKPDPNVWPVSEWTRGKVAGCAVLAARPVTDFITMLHELGVVEVRWHTTWRPEETAVLTELLGLPQFVQQDAPEFLRGSADVACDIARSVTGAVRHRPVWWKLPAALRVVEDEHRALIWTDDDAASPIDLPLAVRRRFSVQPSLILAPPTHTGLAPRHLRFIDKFLTGLAAKTVRELLAHRRTP